MNANYNKFVGHEVTSAFAVPPTPHVVAYNPRLVGHDVRSAGVRVIFPSAFSL